MSDTIQPTEVGALENQLLELEKAVIGKREVVELVLIAVLSDGHVLIEDYPGLAKTLMARSFAQVMTLSFKRIQFTPDLMPSDVTGSFIFDQLHLPSRARLHQPAAGRRDQPRSCQRPRLR